MSGQSRKIMRVFWVAFWVCLWGEPLYAEEGVLHTEPDRITDESIAEDLATIQHFDGRLARVNALGLSAGSYHLSKATAWLDFAEHEYHENDRTGVIEAALRQALALITALEQGAKEISMETPIIATSQKIREDLWQKAKSLKGHKDFHCAEATIAEWEVRLVWAGHDMEEMGWRHARPQIQKAEELAKLADKKIAECPQPVAIVVPPPPPPPPAPPPVEVAIKKLEKLADEVHFALDESLIHEKTAQVLDGIAEVLNAYPVIRLKMIGRADRRGSDAYNLALSERRAEGIMLYLVSRGVARERLIVEAAGEQDAPQTDVSPEAFAKSRQGKFVFYDATRFEPTPQYEDLQIEAPGGRP